MGFPPGRAISAFTFTFFAGDITAGVDPAVGVAATGGRQRISSREGTASAR